MPERNKSHKTTKAEMYGCDY